MYVLWIFRFVFGKKRKQYWKRVLGGQKKGQSKTCIDHSTAFSIKIIINTSFRTVIWRFQSQKELMSSTIRWFQARLIWFEAWHYITDFEWRNIIRWNSLVLFGQNAFLIIVYTDLMKSITSAWVKNKIRKNKKKIHRTLMHHWRTFDLFRTRVCHPEV